MKVVVVDGTCSIFLFRPFLILPLVKILPKFYARMISSTDRFVDFLKEHTTCFIPAITRAPPKPSTPGSMRVCDAMATTFDAAINRDSCVSIWVLLKRGIQLKKAQRNRNKNKQVQA